MAKSKELHNRVLDVEAIGKYIERLRKRRGLTRRELVAEIKGVFDEKSIDDWERRGILPNQESLISLADYFEITIDDLLEGGKEITNEKLLEQYPIFKPYEYKPGESLKGIDLYTPYQTQLLTINKRLKELIIKFNDVSLTRNEDFELRFLFDRMCELNEYAKEIDINLSNDKYLDFIKILNYLKNQNLKKDAFYWEVQKYIEFNRGYCLCANLNVCVSTQQGFEHKKFCMLEPWEKDMDLVRFQNFDILHFDPSDNEYTLERFKEEHGKEYDKEENTKTLIKYLIDNGAVINPWFFSIVKRNKVEKIIVDRLEELYNLCVRPITIYYSNNESEGHELVKATIENNRWNRFLDKYYSFYCIFNDEKYTPQEIYRLLTTDSEKELVYIFARKLSKKEIEGVDYSRLKARVHVDLNIWNKYKEEFFAREKVIEDGLKEISILEEKLKNGETSYYVIEEEEIGPKEPKELYEYICYWKFEQSYNDFLRKRDHKATKELRQEIDNLSLEEIRNKYFPKEAREDE